MNAREFSINAASQPTVPGYSDRHQRAADAAAKWSARRSLTPLERGACRSTLQSHGAFLPTATVARLRKLADGAAPDAGEAA